MKEFSNDLIQAEFSNLTKESGNPWNWKKGEELNRWTDDTDWVIVKINKYPDSGITLKRIQNEKRTQFCKRTIGFI